MVNKIIDGISKALYKEFGDKYEIYTEEMEQGLQEPCFSIICVKPTNNLFRENKYYRQNQFCIHYFPSTSDKRQECQEILEKLYQILEYVKIKDEDKEKTIMGSNMNAEFDDGVLHFFINYNMFVYKVEDKETPMEDYDYDNDIKKG